MLVQGMLICPDCKYPVIFVTKEVSKLQDITT